MTARVKPCPSCGRLYRVRHDGAIRSHGLCVQRGAKSVPYDTHTRARIEQARALGLSAPYIAELLGVPEETVLAVWDAQDQAVAEDQR